MLVALGMGGLDRDAAEFIHAGESLGQQRCGGFPDMANAQRIDETIQLRRAPRIDGVEQLLDRGRAKTVYILELFHRALVARLEREDIGRTGNAALFVELGHLPVAQPIDIKGIAGHEMLELFNGLSGTHQFPGTAALGIHLAGLFIDFTHGGRTTHRTGLGKDEGHGVLRALVEHHVNDLRDNVTGALDDHRIADAQIHAIADRLAIIAQTLDIVLIVQRGILDHHTAHGDRRQSRHRRQRPGAPNLNVDTGQDCCGLFGREFMRNGPAGRARNKAPALLQVEPVQLIDHAINVVAQRGALGLDGAIMGQQFVR